MFDTPNDHEEPGNDPVIVKTEALISLASLLFREFCEEKEIPAESRSAVSPIPFLDWLRERLMILSTEQVDAYIEQAKSSKEAYDALMHMLADPTGANVLQTIWHQVAMSDRGDPKNRLDSVHLIALLKWQDGRAAPLSCYVPRELANPQARLNDAVLCTILQMQTHSLTESIRTIGLDHLHDFRSQVADEEAFDTLMGLNLLVLQGATVIHPHTGQHVKLGPHMIERCQNVMRLLQSMYRPPMPPEVKQQIESRRAQEEIQRQSQAGRPAPVQGGWDQG